MGRKQAQASCHFRRCACHDTNCQSRCYRRTSAVIVIHPTELVDCFWSASTVKYLRQYRLYSICRMSMPIAGLLAACVTRICRVWCFGAGCNSALLHIYTLVASDKNDFETNSIDPRIVENGEGRAIEGVFILVRPIQFKVNFIEKFLSWPIRL